MINFNKVRESILLTKKDKWLFNYLILNHLNAFPKELNHMILDYYIESTKQLQLLEKDELFIFGIELLMANTYSIFLGQELNVFPKNHILYEQLFKMSNSLISNWSTMFQNNIDVNAFKNDEANEAYAKLTPKEINHIKIKIQPMINNMLLLLPNNIKTDCKEFILSSAYFKTKPIHLTNIIFN